MAGILLFHTTNADRYKGFSLLWLLIEKAHDALAIDDASGTFARASSPLRYLVKPQAVFDSRAVDGNHELGHRPHFRGEFVGAEFRNRERYSLVRDSA